MLRRLFAVEGRRFVRLYQHASSLASVCAARRAPLSRAAPDASATPVSNALTWCACVCVGAQATQCCDNELVCYQQNEFYAQCMRPGTLAGHTRPSGLRQAQYLISTDVWYGVTRPVLQGGRDLVL
eukprot:293289-Rhodomonas_salina.1